MYKTAINRNYPITPEMRDLMIQEVHAVLLDPEASKRDKIAAAKVFLAADKFNLESEKTDDGTRVLLELAERLGVRSDVEAIAEEIPGRISDANALREENRLH